MPRTPALPTWISSVEPVYRHEWTGTVAFRDCDPMGVLWHGNYLAYAEQAREALGTQIGLAVADFRAHGWFAPVVRSQVWHHVPARPGQALRIAVALYATAQPRLFHRYHFLSDQTLLASAETEQVVTNTAFTLLLQQPPALAAILKTNA